ncbi:cupin domain-containing protein [Ciceribacter sp. L1K22]|uniref:cupin domain-containing protein n=1 Tax=Ciceribacter sp. L1K22 TaxID=2820275 RepID=UPI001ABE1795|nr:cupin domain-containing protein [Ciceribacter sp. L1K22]MBO3759751.1 cupin domain-containing protein [Ciceribacter sp. L1K22]
MSATFVSPDSAETLWVVRDKVRFMGDVEGKNLSVLEVMVPPGSGTPPHMHDSAEIFRVLDGEITFGLFDTLPPRHIVAGPGSVVTIGSGEPHNYVNTGGRPAEMLVIVDTAMKQFFKDLGRVEEPEYGPPSAAEIAQVQEACARHGISMLG